MLLHTPYTDLAKMHPRKMPTYEIMPALIELRQPYMLA